MFLGRIRVAFVALFVLMGCHSCQLRHNRQHVEIGDAVSVTCEEDMPCWDCVTMGNHICGPVTR